VCRCEKLGTLAFHHALNAVAATALPLLLRAQLVITWLCCVLDVDHKRLNCDLA
jgi:hypothetical protein